MPRRSLLLLCCTAALGQVQPRDPFDRAMQSYQQARAQGNPSEAAARRQDARRLVEQMPVDSPAWAGRVRMLAQMYQGSGRHVEARKLIEDALERAQVFPEWHPVRMELVSGLADFWQQDGNLLKAVAYREKAVAALEAAPPGAAIRQEQPAPAGVAGIVGGSGKAMVYLNRSPAFRSGRGGNNAYLYEQLAELYRQLGRPEAAAKAVVKMRSLLQNNPGALAQSYEREGDLDQARALYLKQAQDAQSQPQAQPWEVAGPLESIAFLDQREDRWAEAAATFGQAAARLDGFSEPAARSQALNIRLNMANALQRAGQPQASDELYQALLNQTANEPQFQQFQVLQQYANHLSQTARGAQGMQMLKDYLASHNDLQPFQQTNVLFSLAQMARQAGQNDLADEYQRAAQEKQRAMQPPQPASRQLIGAQMEKAREAASQGDLDGAVNLALGAIASASMAPDGDQIAFQLPSLAGLLVSKKAPEKAEQIYRALFPMLEARSVDSVAPLNQSLHAYARFLTGQKDRLGDAALAIDSYRESLAATQGEETNAIEQVAQLRLDLARAKGAPEEIAQRADEVLAFEDSLSGSTSAPYMRVAQMLTGTYQSLGKTDRALALHRQIVAIADRTLPPDNSQRGQVRMNAAMAFAAARQFDEAQRLTQEAVVVAQALHPPRPDLFRAQAEQIQRMKAAAESGAPARGANGVVIGTPWQR